LERCEWELHLSLDPRGSQDPKATPLLDRPVEQRRLPDTWFAKHHQGPAVAAARGVEQAVEHFALAVAAEQLGSRRPAERHTLRGRAHPGTA
jgi:hypothetical protein